MDSGKLLLMMKPEDGESKEDFKKRVMDQIIAKKVVNALDPKNEEIELSPISDELNTVNKIFTNILANCNDESRKQFRNFLNIWEDRIDFVNLLQDEADRQDSNKSQ